MRAAGLSQGSSPSVREFRCGPTLPHKRSARPAETSVSAASVSALSLEDRNHVPHERRTRMKHTPGEASAAKHLDDANLFNLSGPIEIHYSPFQHHGATA